MKIKNMIVEIKTFDNSLKEFKEAYKKVASGKSVNKKEVVSFESIDVMRKLLTPKRLELIKLIRHNAPNSVYELAKLANRDAKSVNTDVKILSSLGMIEATVSKSEKKNIIPHVTFDKIRLEIPI